MKLAVPVRRRRLLQSAGALSLAAAGVPAARAAASSDTFDNTRFAALIAALGGMPTPNPAITLEVPQVAENGALVSVSISSALPDTRELLILVDINPQPLALRFAVPEGTEPFVATRIRMAASGTVVAAVRTGDGRLHAVAQSVQVTVGGCG